MEIKPGQIYKHYKGNHYEIIVVGKHSETQEEMVAYKRVEDGKVWFRPKDMFFDEIEINGEKTTRFVLEKDA